MSHNLMGEQRRGGRGTFHGRQRWRMRPTLLELEARTLLSTIVVNNPTDTPVAGKTDLRQAIVLANTNGGAETITFDKKVFATPQTINLNPALGQLELSDTTGPETITGPKAGVTVDGNYTTAGLANSVFKIDPGVTATLSGLTITGGNNGDYGGGVDNAGHGDAHRLHRSAETPAVVWTALARRRSPAAPSAETPQEQSTPAAEWSATVARRHSPTARSAETPQASAAAGCGATATTTLTAARSAATRQPRAAG